MTECTWKEEKRNRAVLVGLNAHCLSAEDNADDIQRNKVRRCQRRIVWRTV